MTGGHRGGYRAEILLISFAALLLEISYTRVVSFKLYYYYTYLVIGLALLGLGAGGVAVSVWKRLRAATTEQILRWGLFGGAGSVLLGYLIVAWMPIRTMAIWDYGSGQSFTNLVKLLVCCLALFASFIAVGVLIATLFARRPADIGRLYCFDLLGAGLACAVVVPLISVLGPPTIIAIAAVVLAATGMRHTTLRLPTPGFAAIGVAAIAAVAVVGPAVLPDVRLDDDKADITNATESQWSPVFRVDSADFFGTEQIIYHDGLPGSVVLEWDGDPDTLDELAFEIDPRTIPFDTVDTAPEHALIIGAAGGHEVLVALSEDVDEIDAVELNPATHDLVTGELADYSGRFFEQPGVDYVTGDGRSYLARSDATYDLIWYPAPDSYAATNTSAAGAFVLSESYLYTTEMIDETFDHLADDGVLVAQFGELNYDARANRTLRYLSTVRETLTERGVADPGAHVLVATTADFSFPSLRYSTILVGKTPFTAAEILRFAATVEKPETRIEYLPGDGRGGSGAETPNDVATVLTQPAAELDEWLSNHRYDLTPVTDDAPFFWHFDRFTDVLRRITEPIHPAFVDPELAVGERVLVLLVAIAAVLATVFLVLPFVLVRDEWAALPRKGTSGVYFAALGLGFMFFEITLMQRLVLFLGYPTYSLTVTLASLLLFTGVGAVLSNRFANARVVSGRLLGSLAALTVLYLVVLPVVTDGLLGAPLAVRVVTAFVATAPLGLCLGVFMPVGLRTVSGLAPAGGRYVAWAWAVNGFASVIGSVLTTVLAMIVGFRAVLIAGLVVYAIAVLALRMLTAAIPAPAAVAQPADLQPVG